MWDRWTRHWRLTRRLKHSSTSSTSREKEQSPDNRAKASDPEKLRSPRRRMTKKPSPTKTRTGNALAQFVILSALTVVAYQFLAARLLYSDAPSASTPPLDSVDGMSNSPTPWTDAALEKYRAKQRAADREVISTTEFSCFMACIGLFGLMQRKKKRSEEEAIEAQRRAVEARIHRGREGEAKFMRTMSDEAIVSTMAISEFHSPRACDALAELPSDVRVELLTFLSAEELVDCAMVNRAWHVATGDGSERLWSELFRRDLGESGNRFGGIVPRICGRQYYFLHRLSRAVELARWLDQVEQRKCVVIQGHVYDVTTFLDAHPGGYHVIGDVLGTDATELWYEFQHSNEAKELMKDFLVEDAVLTARSQRDADGTGVPQKHLALAQNRWRQITWCINHAHLLGGLSSTFLKVGFKFIEWRTTTSALHA